MVDGLAVGKDVGQVVGEYEDTGDGKVEGAIVDITEGVAVICALGPAVGSTLDAAEGA
jgi:hypothetical protein